MNNKNYLKRIWIGVKLGWNTPSLPENVINLHEESFNKDSSCFRWY